MRVKQGKSLSMDEEFIKRRLTEIYDSRLKALIGYKSTAFTKEIVDYMFEHFDYLDRATENEGYGNLIPQSFMDILSFTPGKGTGMDGVAGLKSHQLPMYIENYIRTNVDLLYPDWQREYKSNEYRKVMGTKFEKEVTEHPERYPERLRPKDFLSPLNNTTDYRNQLAHNPVLGGSGMYYRYYILQAYDVILSFLIYTFYYMALNPRYELRNIKN